MNGPRASETERKGKTACPFCSGQKVSKSNSLAFLRPEIAAEWHPTLNGDLTPDGVTVGSSKKVWWKCHEVSNHKWQAAIDARTLGKTGCPYCYGSAVSGNSFAEVWPNLAKEWHPTKNGKLKPSEVSANSGKRIWWLCSANSSHEWATRVTNRTIRKTGCPICRVGWTVAGIRSFVDSLKDHLSSFTPAELYVLFQQNGLLSGDRKSQAFVDALATGRFPFEEIEKFCKGETSLVDSFLADSSLTLESLDEPKPATETELGAVGESQEESAELPSADTADVLKSLSVAGDRLRRSGGD